MSTASLDRRVDTLSWLNFSRSLSHAKEESRRRCSDRRSEPALVEAWTCAGMLIPCGGKMGDGYQQQAHIGSNQVFLLTCVSTGGSSDCSLVL